MPERIRIQQGSSTTDILLDIPIPTDGEGLRTTRTRVELFQLFFFWMNSQVGIRYAETLGANGGRLERPGRGGVEAHEFGSTQFQGRSWKLPSLDDAGGVPSIVIHMAFQSGRIYCPVFVAISGYTSGGASALLSELAVSRRAGSRYVGTRFLLER